MASNEPPAPKPGPTGDPEPTDEDALGRLEQRLDRASEAAERLLGEAAARVVRPQGGTAEAANSEPASPGAAAEGERRPPPAGWQIPDHGEDWTRGTGRGTGRGPDSRTEGEVDLLLHVLSSLRDRIPPELQQRLGDALREVLLAVRALIDWYLERSERRRAEPVEVQDIPIM